jgi:hypothetical protein
MFFVYLIAPAALLVLLGLVLLARVPKDERRKLPIPILVLPMFWLFVALWGYFFSIPFGGVQPDWAADWVGYPLLATPILYVLACFVISSRLPESGPFLLPYSLANLYLLLIASFASGFAISGDAI